MAISRSYQPTRCDFNKFAARFEGPFPIPALVGDTSARLTLPVSCHIDDPFHVRDDVSAFTELCASQICACTVAVTVVHVWCRC